MKLWVNGEQREVTETSQGTLSVAQLVTELGWPAQRVAVERNGNVVPKPNTRKPTCSPETKSKLLR